MQAEAVNQLVPFQFESMTVRAVIGSDGEPAFLARDVALALGYNDTDQAVRAHCKAAATYPVEITGQVRSVKVIPERDVYRLIMRSKLPEAERFEEWVVGTVLPSIRKTGGFVAKFNVPKTFPEALRLAADLSDENTVLREAIAEQQPRLNALRRIAEAEGSFCISDAAKMLQMPPKQLFTRLNEMRWIFKRPGCAVWLGYQDKTQAGLLVHKSTLVTREDGTEKVAEQVRITGRGIARVATLLGAAVVEVEEATA